MKNILMVLALAALSACAGKQVNEDQAPASAASQSKPMQDAPAQQPEAAAARAVPEDAVDPLKDPASMLSKRNVYFDYDNYEIRQEFRPLIKAHAEYLVRHPSANITLQGHADDRGSHEYNLALGQKRAVAVKKMMNVLGVSDRQIETISFGEEKPKSTGHDEASWAENRRTDIVYSGE